MLNQHKNLNKFLNGLIYGAGFGVALIVVMVIFFMFFFEPLIEKQVFSSSEYKGTSVSIDSPPALEEEKKFLGSQAIYSGGFMDNKKGVLKEGPGKIVGKLTVNRKPVAGVKIQLALNGAVLSQWGQSDANGQYAIPVPYGKYKVDGYELDRKTANKFLTGKINHPQSYHFSSAFEVSEQNAGKGISLEFVDPLIKNIPKKTFSSSDEIVIGWSAYPGADDYRIQIYEKTEPHSYIGNEVLFKRSSRPRVTKNSINLKKQGVKLKPGHFYVFEIVARNMESGVISETVRMHTGYDIEISK